MFTKLPATYYHSTQGIVCVVPSTRFDGVILKDGQPIAVSLINYHYYRPAQSYNTLKGLNTIDLKVSKPDLIYYEIAEGQILVADAEAIAKATLGTNNASSTGEDCLIHVVSDLRLVSELPEKVADVEPLFSF